MPTWISSGGSPASEASRRRQRVLWVGPGQVVGGELAEHVGRGERILIDALGHRGPRTGQIHRRGHQHGGRGQVLPGIAHGHQQGGAEPAVGRAADHRPGMSRSGPGQCAASARRPGRRRRRREKHARGPAGTPGTAPASRWPGPAGRPVRRHCAASRARNRRRAGTTSPGRRSLPALPARPRLAAPGSPPPVPPTAPPRRLYRLLADITSHISPGNNTAPWDRAVDDLQHDRGKNAAVGTAAELP